MASYLMFPKCLRRLRPQHHMGAPGSWSCDHITVMPDNHQHKQMHCYDLWWIGPVESALVLVIAFFL